MSFQPVKIGICDLILQEYPFGLINKFLYQYIQHDLNSVKNYDKMKYSIAKNLYHNMIIGKIIKLLKIRDLK